MDTELELSKIEHLACLPVSTTAGKGGDGYEEAYMCIHVRKKLAYLPFLMGVKMKEI